MIKNRLRCAAAQSFITLLFTALLSTARLSTTLSFVALFFMASFFAALIVSGCGTGAEVGAGEQINGERGHSSAKLTAGGGSVYNYTVTSASALPVGVRVAVVRADVSESCVFPGRVSAFSPVASGEVISAGSVSLSFADERGSAFVEIIYIDSNASERLDSGDRVWGTNPEDPAGVCFTPSLKAAHTVNWDGVAAVTGGSATYAGDAQDFLAAAVGESRLPVSTLIIGESGYENL